MSKFIYEYPLSQTGLSIQIIVAPITKLLTIQVQNNVPCLWAEVDTDIPDKIIEIRILGTGWKIPQFPTLTYLSTIQDAQFVWHYYYRIIKSGE